MATGGLLAHLITALGAAAGGAALALLFRQPLIIGYLLAGVAIGPFTPGVMGDTDAISELAEVGVIFLMFVIGMQLSLRELARASRVAIAGALLQVAALVGIGYLAGRALGLSHLEAYALGAVISNSSSTVLGKILSDRGELDTRHAQLGLAWSSVQDLSTVVLIAVLVGWGPRDAAAGGESAGSLLLKVAAFLLVVVPIAFWVVPRVLRRASAVGSREFFVLVVFTLALSMAGAASLLGVSLALGAFLTGIVVGETDLAHRVLSDTLPVRDVFSAVFFVSIGMLFNPMVFVDAWHLVALVTLLIVAVKGVVVALFARALGATLRLAILLGVGLAQSGEFSFLLARFAFEQQVLSREVFNLVLTSTVVSILIAPLVSARVPAALSWLQRRRLVQPAPEADVVLDELKGHAIVCGYGRVGTLVCELLVAHKMPFVVIDEDLRVIEVLRAQGVPVVLGDAGVAGTLDRARVQASRLVILAIPERMATRRALDYAHRAGSATILARTHSDEDRRFLQQQGADEAVVGEVELAFELGRRALLLYGVGREEVARSIAEVRAGLDRPAGAPASPVTRT